jgi:hypothetical protein
MARFLKKVGAPAPSRFMFDMQIHSVDIRVPYEVAVVVVWKRGPKRVETQSMPNIDDK